MDEENLFKNGHIALHQDAGALIEFGKVEILELLVPSKVGEASPSRKGGFLVGVPTDNSDKWRARRQMQSRCNRRGPLSSSGHLHRGGLGACICDGYNVACIRCCFG